MKICGAPNKTRKCETRVEVTGSHKHASLLCYTGNYCRKSFLVLSHMIFSFFNDKRLLAPKYSGASSHEVLCPFIFLNQFSNRMLCPFILLIRSSDQISLFFSVYKLPFQILINTYELDFIVSTSFTIQYMPLTMSSNIREMFIRLQYFVFLIQK